MSHSSHLAAPSVGWIAVRSIAIAVLSCAALVACGHSGDDDVTSSPVPEVTPTESPATTTPPAPSATPLSSTPEPATMTPEPATMTPEPATMTPEPATPTPIPPRGTLSSPVEVRFDTTGAPHIYAENDHDLFFAQGYLAAHQRLFQMELNRLQALGRKTEIHGSGSLGEDMLVRALRPIAHAEDEMAAWEGVRDRELGWFEAYVEGVNGYIDDALAGRNGASLPDAMIALDYRPDYYTVPQLFAMDYMFGITLGPDPLLELTITILDIALGDDAMLDLLKLAPIEDAYTVPDAQVAAVAAGRAVSPASHEGAPAPSHGARVHWPPELRAHIETLMAQPEKRRQVLAALPRIQALDLFKRFSASNAWVVHGEHTSSGFPLLANDPHMGIDTPNLFHQVHLNTRQAGGDLDIMGVVAAGGPGIILGHNDRVGWGVTTSYFDVTDLYLEVPATGPAAPGGGVWFEREVVPYETWDETFRIRQADGSYTEEVHQVKRVPHHGPVLPPELLGLPEELVISMKWAGEPDGSTLGTILKFILAHDIDDIRTAMEAHKLGAGNFVFATVDGDIAYDPTTRLPIRQGDDGSPPWYALPGTGGFEWTGDTIPPDQIPHAYNPPAGFLVTANNDPSGDTADGDPLNDGTYLGATYASGMRARRIDQWLRSRIAAGTPVSAEDMVALQGDVDSLMARRLVPYLLQAADRRPDLVDTDDQAALSLLQDWDYLASGDSPAAALYATWWPTAFQEIFEDDLIPDLFTSFNGDYGQYYARPLVYFLDATADNIDAIDAGTAPFPSATGVNYFDDTATEGTVETRDEQLLEAFHRSVAHLSALLGPDPSGWRWDAIHTATLNNASSPWVTGLDRGPYPLDGTGYTVDCADSVLFENGNPPELFDVWKGPVMRTVMDFDGGIIRTYITLAGGQVDDPDSAHFNDQTDDWVANVARPQPFTRAEVEAATEETWILPSGFPGVAPQLNP